MKVAGMSRAKKFTPKFIASAIRYVVYFLAVALTPYLAKPIAPLFDWAGYSLMRPMFVEIFTVIFWGVEWWIIFSVEKRIKKKKTKKTADYLQAAANHFLTAEKSEQAGENSAAISKHFLEKVQSRSLTTEEEREMLYRAAFEQKKRKIRPPLPFKNVAILTVLSVLCIFIISAVTGFKVKPIYDIGEKVTGYEMYNKIAILGRNVFKCFWILGMVKASKGMAEELVLTAPNGKEKAWTSRLLQTVFLLIFGLFDVLTSVMVYPLTLTRALVGLTYLLFYIAFIPVQALTQGSDIKAFLLIVLIYLF